MLSSGVFFRLSSEFVKSYEHVKPPFGFNGLGELVYLRTYSRTKDDGSKEKWFETIERVVNGTYSIQKRHMKSHRLPWDEKKAQKSAQEMYDRMFHMKFLPPGRGLWAMGAPVIEERGLAAALNNCFSADTEIITRDGVKPIGELVGTEQELLSVGGKWVKAPINSFGKQQLMKLTIRRNGINKEIFTTKDHRWFIRTQSDINHGKKQIREVTTSELNPSDRLQYVFGQGVLGNVRPSPQGVGHGIAFGDGTLGHPSESCGSYLYLVGQKDKELLKFFPNNYATEAKSVGAAGAIRVADLPRFFKHFPSLRESKSYLYGWLSGYFAADGSIGQGGGNIVICSANLENIKFVRDVCNIIGIGTYGIQKSTQTVNHNGEVKKFPSYKIGLFADCLDDEFFILNHHKARFRGRKSTVRHHWNVVSVDTTDRFEEVFCATVPVYGCFALSDNILTGNCSYVSTEKLADNPTLPFTFMMDALMLGVGVGFDTKGANTVKVFRPLDGPGETIVIPDSREGWIDSLEALLWAFFKSGQQVPVFDYSEIRPAGSPIKGFGGLASGHGILKDCHDYVRDLLLSYTEGYFDRWVSDRLIVDLMNLIGKCIVSGNVRRSSQIALGDPDSKDYLDLKNYSVNPDRATFGWASNNSIYSSLGQDYKDISDRIRINGEPGLLWVENVRNHGRMMDPPDTKDIRSSGTNPCKPSKSLVLTDCGYKTIGQLFRESFDTITVMTQHGWKSATKPFKTRESVGVWKIKLSDGTFLYGTANHVHQMSDGQRKRIDELKIGDRFSRLLTSIYSDLGVIDQVEYENGLLAGWFHAEGSVVKLKDRENGYQFSLFFGHHEFDVGPLFEQIVGKRAKPHNQRPDTCRVITTKDNSLRDRLFGFGYSLDKNDLTWLYGKTKEFKIGFLRSVFTADGSVRLKDSGGGTELYSVRYSSLETICNILKEFGIHSTICVHGSARRTEYAYGVRNNSTTYKIRIPNSQFFKIGFLSEYKSELLSELTKTTNSDNHYLTSKFDDVRVVSIDIDDSVEDVYCLTVNDDDHLFVDTGVLTSNCAEMALESYELCCLVETFPYKHENYQDFARTLKFAYLYAKTVTLLATHWPETNKVMMRNRRIGCSMSGIAQFLSNRGVAELRSWCENGYKEIKRWDNTYSEWLAVPKSNRVTTVKPSGSVSLLCGSTPGVHFPESRFYIRRVRLAKNSDLVEPLRIAGYHIEDAFGDHNTVVVEIPVDSGPGVRSVSEVPMWEQLTLAAMLQEVWSDNSVSVTISFDPFHEGHQIEHALKYFQYKLKTVSFLPRVAGGAYPQMPYEEITEEKYLELISNLSNAVFDSAEAAEMTDKYCSGDKCVVNL